MVRRYFKYLVAGAGVVVVGVSAVVGSLLIGDAPQVGTPPADALYQVVCLSQPPAGSWLGQVHVLAAGGTWHALTDNAETAGAAAAAGCCQTRDCVKGWLAWENVLNAAVSDWLCEDPFGGQMRCTMLVTVAQAVGHTVVETDIYPHEFAGVGALP